ncbi:TK protein kinase, variant [Salpingoeca rosetta]|uniref:TK protein kinase, variant n=1 Tax=Salpingoeca rosetta (strain ATCC 50818 / BSB-021) TaxID=946362 RepID=F2UA50_SALR5|nr:TK protein kinase, variant [Salpingoeca rosetta]EGD73624.1 TK protein kinase, variant [Salpingoeca rosetta]|eukprot:XP_004993905.1 TK protein kinase, variant [Salpingoeca rosetta]
MHSHTCASATPLVPDDCNVVHLESDEYPEVTGNYVAVEIDVNPNGCVPTTVFVADDFGFANSLVFFAAVADYGFSPENVAWRNLDKTWLLYEYVDYAIIFEGAALNGFITAEPVPLTKQVSDTSPSALTGVWDLRVGTGLRRPTDVSATCMSKFPCSRPFITPAPSSIDDNMDIPAKLQALQSTPRIAARAQRILYTTLHHHFTLSVLALHKPMLNAFYTASLPNTATRAFIPTIARITCEGASRANATISVPTVAVVLDMLEEIHAEGSFSLSLAPYATYLCTINTIGDTCIPATIEDKVLITPPLPPLAPVRGLEVTHVTRACVDVRWAPISPLEFRGPLLGYDVVITQGGVPISSVRVLQAHAHVCNLRVGQPYNVSVTADNGVGRTDPVSVPFYAASGVIEVRLNVTAERIDDIDDIDDSDDSVQLSWLPLSRQAGAGTIQRYHIAVFSARRLSDLRSLSLPHSTDPAELVTATPDRCTFEGLTIMSASSVHSTDPNAKVVVVLSGFAPHLAYAIAVAPENREHVGPFSSIATVDATISAASSGGSGLLLAETIAIVTIVLVIAVIGLVIVIVRHRAHRAGTKRTRIKLPSDIGAFTIRNSSSVLAVRLLFSDPFFDVFAGHMPKWNAEARCMVEQPITIKQLRDPQDRDHLDVLRNEVCALHALRNSDHRVIELIGVHIHKRLAFIVVSPKRCSLHRLLLDSRAIPGRPALIDLPQLVQLATQVIAGLSFVHERRIVHRALCAAHIFVHENGQLQIGGFSAAIVLPKPTKSSGGKRKPGRIDTEKLSEAVLSDLLQVRWMAPESIADCVFNFASDTYSLGVVLWELFTYGQQPWAGFSNAEVAQNVAKLGRTLARPQACPMQLYQVMKSCWDANPPDRPVLPALSEQLQQAINSSLLESLSSFKSTDGLHRGHESPLEQKPSRTSLFGNVEALDVTGLGIFGGDDDTAVADMSPNDRDQMMMVYMMGHKDDQDEDNWTNRTSSRPASPKANTRFSFV